MQEEWTKQAFTTAAESHSVPKDEIEKAWSNLTQGRADAGDPTKKQPLRKSSRFTDGGVTLRERAGADSSTTFKTSWLEGEKGPLFEQQLQPEALVIAVDSVKNMLPIEKKTLMCFQLVMKLAQSIRVAKNEHEHDLLSEQIKEQITLMGQLTSSVKSATSELNSIAKKRKAAHDKAEEKKRNEALRLENEKAAGEKKRLQKETLMDPFHLDFAGAQLPRTHEFEAAQTPGRIYLLEALRSASKFWRRMLESALFFARHFGLQPP